MAAKGVAPPRTVIRFRPGFPSRGQKAAACMREIEDVARKVGGHLDGKVLMLNIAKGSACGRIIYHLSDKALADQARINLADNLIVAIQRVRIVQTPDGGVEEEAHRVFIGYIDEADDEAQGTSYAPRLSVLSRKDVRAQVLESALRDIDSWVRRYEDISEVRPLVKAVRQAIARHGG